jgi:hypothetical protein
MTNKLLVLGYFIFCLTSITKAQIKKEAVYLRSEAGEFWENLGGDIGLVHLQNDGVIFLINGKETSFTISGDIEYNNFKKARMSFGEFWSKNPQKKERGAHGILYDATNKLNVGKKYEITYKKSKTSNELILLSYKSIGVSKMPFRGDLNNNILNTNSTIVEENDSGVLIFD